MKKAFLLLVMICVVALTTYAQSDNTLPKIGIGFDIGATTGPPSGNYPVSGGLILKAEYPLKDTPLNFVLITGFDMSISNGNFQVTNFNEPDDDSEGSIAAFIPAQVGIKYYASKRFFIEGDLGASFNVTRVWDFPGTPKTALLVSPSAGYTIPFGRTRGSCDLSLAYENRLQNGGGFGQVALRGIFNFNL